MLFDIVILQDVVGNRAGAMMAVAVVRLLGCRRGPGAFKPEPVGQRAFNPCAKRFESSRVLQFGTTSSIGQSAVLLSRRFAVRVRGRAPGFSESLLPRQEIVKPVFASCGKRVSRVGFYCLHIPGFATGERGPK